MHKVPGSVRKHGFPGPMPEASDVVSMYLRRGVRLLKEEHVFLKNSRKGRLKLLRYFEAVTGEHKRVFSGLFCYS